MSDQNLFTWEEIETSEGRAAFRDEVYLKATKHVRIEDLHPVLKATFFDDPRRLDLLVSGLKATFPVPNFTREKLTEDTADTIAKRFCIAVTQASWQHLVPRW